MEGIKPEDLVKKKQQDFEEPGVPEKVVAMRFKFYQNKRKGQQFFMDVRL